MIVDKYIVESDDEKTNMFGIGPSMEKSSQTLVVGELFLFWRFYSFVYLSKSIN